MPGGNSQWPCFRRPPAATDKGKHFQRPLRAPVRASTSYLLEIQTPRPPSALLRINRGHGETGEGIIQVAVTWEAGSGLRSLWSFVAQARMPLDCFVAKPPRSDDLHRPSSRSRTWAEAIQAPPSPPVIARSPRRSDPGPPLRWTASSQGLLAVTDTTTRHREEFPTKRSKILPPLDCFVRGKRYARPRACRRMAACRISPTVFSGVSVVKN